mgnify:FL=1
MQDNQQAMNDDQELAKVLAGVSQTTGSGLSFEETGAASMPAAVNSPIDSVIPVNTPTMNPGVPMNQQHLSVSSPQASPQPVQQSAPKPNAPVAPQRPQANSTSVQVNTPPTRTNLDGVKQAALGDLRPLVNKLDVSPEEKFDACLLLLRSTDDQALVVPAYEAAKSISDEKRRAEALLSIIKEIDYLSNAK